MQRNSSLTEENSSQLISRRSRKRTKMSNIAKKSLFPSELSNVRSDDSRDMSNMTTIENKDSNKNIINDFRENNLIDMGVISTIETHSNNEFELSPELFEDDNENFMSNNSELVVNEETLSMHDSDVTETENSTEDFNLNFDIDDEVENSSELQNDTIGKQEELEYENHSPSNCDLLNESTKEHISRIDDDSENTLDCQKEISSPKHKTNPKDKSKRLSQFHSMSSSDSEPDITLYSCPPT